MENQKVIYVRVDKEIHKDFHKYAVDHDSNMNAVIESLIQVLLETNIGPKEAIAAIRAAKKKPGE